MAANSDFHGQPQPETSLNRREWALALAAALLAAFLHAALATRRGYWYDEYLTIHSAKMNLADLCRNRLEMGHSPLYFIYAKLGLLLGEGQRAIRLTSALATALLVLGLTGAAGALGLRAALPALWLTALLQPYWISIGTQVRYMMPMLAVAAFVLWAAAAYAAHPDARRGAALALLTALLLWLHASAQFFVIALAVFLFWDGLSHADARPAAARLLRLWPIVAGVLLSLPLLFLIRHHGGYRDPDFPNWLDLQDDLLEVTLGYYRLWPDFFHVSGELFFVALSAVSVATLGLAAWQLRRRGQLRARRLLVSLVVVLPLVFALFCGLGRDFSGPARYLTLWSLPFGLAMAVALGAAPSGGPVPRIHRFYQAALLGLLALQALGAAIERGDHHREACRWLADNALGGETILMTPSKCNMMGLKDYCGFDEPGRCISIYSERDDARLRAIFSQALARVPRVFYIIYFSKDDPILGATIDKLKMEKIIVADRHWHLSPRTIVGAFVNHEAEKPWLNNLVRPELDWGPARGKTGG